MSSVVEVGFEFLSQLAGDHVLGAEVDNLAQVVRLRIRGPHTPNPDPVGVAPAVSQRCYPKELPYMSNMSTNTKPHSTARLDLLPLLNRVDDCCARLGISRGLFYRWIKTGRVEIVKLGTRTLISEVELRRVAADLVRTGKAESFPVLGPKARGCSASDTDAQATKVVSGRQSNSATRRVRGAA